MIQLSKERLLALAGIYDGAGLQAVLDVLENIITESENSLIGERPGDAEEIVALHAIAHAQRALFIEAINHIDVQVADQRGVEKKDTMDKRPAK
jgi:hypothetical protein